MTNRPLFAASAPRPPALPAIITAEPQPLEIDLNRTALVVVDMQNAFAARGGYFDLWGADISAAPAAAANIARLAAAVRGRGLKVVYVCQVYSEDLHEAGAHDSAVWWRSGIAREGREHPERLDKGPIRGKWGAAVIDAIAPKPGDITVEKIRHSGFFETSLDTTLKTIDAKYLLFTGTEMSMCVENTLHDAFYRGYFGVLVADACMTSAAKPFRTQATLYNVSHGIGWVADTENVLKVIAR